MKNVNLVLVAIILAGVFYLSFTEKSPAKPEGGEWEVMYVAVVPPQAEINVFKPNQQMTTIKIPGGFTGKGWEKSGEIIVNTIQGFYDEGWEIQTSTGEARLHYVFKRKK